MRRQIAVQSAEKTSMSPQTTDLRAVAQRPARGRAPGSCAGIGVAGKDADPKAWQSHVERSRTPPGAARASQRGRTLPGAALDVDRAELGLDRRQRGVDLGAVADV